MRWIFLLMALALTSCGKMERTATTNPVGKFEGYWVSFWPQNPGQPYMAIRVNQFDCFYSNWALDNYGTPNGKWKGTCGLDPLDDDILVMTFTCWVEGDGTECWENFYNPQTWRVQITDGKLDTVDANEPPSQFYEKQPAGS